MKNNNIKTLFLGLALSCSYSNTYAQSDLMQAAKYEQSLQDMQHKLVNKALTAQRSARVGSIAESVTIDFMAFYQSSYAKLIGEQKVHERIARMVEVTNEVLANTKVDATVRLVNAQPVTGIDDSLPYYDVKDSEGNYVSEGVAGLFSDHVLSPYNNYVENSVYQAFGADLVMYIREYRVEEETPLGVASAGRQLTSVFDKTAIDPDFHAMDAVLAHEIGHNLNAGHELGETAGQVLEEYSHAFKCDNKGTIMWSASSGKEISEHLFFSDPERSENGEMCGDPTSANNTKTIKENVGLAAQYQDAPTVLGTVSFTATNYNVYESDGTGEVTITRTGDLTQASSVQVALNAGTASYASDYLIVWERVEFAAGEANATFTIDLVNDAINESVETAELVLRYPYRLSVAQGAATLTIHDAGQGNVGSIEVVTPEIMTEGEGAEITIKRINGSDGQLTVRVQTEGGTANNQFVDDYVHMDELVVFGNGESEKVVTINVIDDEVKEFTESFYVNVSTTMEVAIENPRVEVTIQDNDQNSTALQLGQIDMSVESEVVNEDAGTFTVTVNRVNGNDGYVEAYIRIDGEGVETFVEKVAFFTGEQSKSITVVVNDNTQVDGDKVVSVHLVEPTTDVITSTLEITIKDNDVATSVTPPTQSTSSDSSGGGSIGMFGLMVIALVRVFRG